MLFATLWFYFYFYLLAYVFVAEMMPISLFDKHPPSPGVDKFQWVKGNTIISVLQYTTMDSSPSAHALQYVCHAGGGTVSSSQKQKAFLVKTVVRWSDQRRCVTTSLELNTREVDAQGCVLQMFLSSFSCPVPVLRWGCLEDMHFPFSQGCWHLESNF